MSNKQMPKCFPFNQRGFQYFMLAGSCPSPFKLFLTPLQCENRWDENVKEKGRWPFPFIWCLDINILHIFCSKIEITSTAVQNSISLALLSNPRKAKQNHGLVTDNSLVSSMDSLHWLRCHLGWSTMHQMKWHFMFHQDVALLACCF